MQFIKKHYEKMLLGLALAALVAALALLFVLVGREQQKAEDRRTQIVHRHVDALAAPDLAEASALLARAAAPVALNYSDDTNKLFNPVRWVREANGDLARAAAAKVDVQIITNTPLYLVITLDRITVAPNDQLRFEVGVEQQAAAKPRYRGKNGAFMSKGDKKDFGPLSLTLVAAKGDTNNAVLTLSIADTEEKVTVSKDKPFRRVDGYLTTLKYRPENRTFPPRRQDESISFAGEEYKIVAIHPDEVVLSAQSNQKKLTIRSNSAP